MIDHQKRLEFAEDGSLTIPGGISDAELLDALHGELKKFLARMDSSERSLNGNVTPTSPQGPRVLWQNIILLAVALQARHIPDLRPEERERYEAEKVFFSSEPVRFPRKFVPLNDALAQLVLLMPQDREPDAWMRSIPAERIAQARSILEELELYRRGLGESIDSRGEHSAARAAPSLGEISASSSSLASAENLVGFDETLITLDQAGAIINRKKRTMEEYLKQGKIPRPDFPGGDGKAHRWRWSTIRESLEQLGRRKLPPRFPGNQFS